jgi:hypothetical protein
MYSASYSRESDAIDSLTDTSLTGALVVNSTIGAMNSILLSKLDDGLCLTNMAAYSNWQTGMICISIWITLTVCMCSRVFKFKELNERAPEAEPTQASIQILEIPQAQAVSSVQAPGDAYDMEASMRDIPKATYVLVHDGSHVVETSPTTS